MFSPSDDSPSTSPATEGSLNRNISNILSLLETPIRKDCSETESFTPDVKLPHLLKDVTAYVEVRSNFENRSKAIMHQLIQLGATVVPKFTNEVTHIVFKDGKKSTKDKAKKKGIHLVSVSWIEACKKNQSHMPEEDYPANIRDEAAVPLAVSRLKKSKSMQPKDFEEELANSAEKVERRRKMREKKDKLKLLEAQVTPLQYRNMVLVAETQPMSPIFFSPSITVPETPPSMRRKLEQLRKKKALAESSGLDVSGNTADSIQGSPGSPGDATGNTLSPLQKRLFSTNSTSASPSCSTTSSSMGVTPLNTDYISEVHESVFGQEESPHAHSAKEGKCTSKKVVKNTGRSRRSSAFQSSKSSMSTVNRSKKEHTDAKRTSPNSSDTYSIKTKGKRKLMSLDEGPVEKLLSPANNSNKGNVAKSTCSTFPSPKRGSVSKTSSSGKNVSNKGKGKKRKSDDVTASGSDKESKEQKRLKTKVDDVAQTSPPTSVAKPSTRRRSMAVAPALPTRTSRRRSCMPAISTPTSDCERVTMSTVSEEQSQGCADAPDINTPEIKPKQSQSTISTDIKSIVRSKVGGSIPLRRSSRRSSVLGTLKLQSISESPPKHSESMPTRSKSIGLDNIEEQPSLVSSSYMSVAYSALGAPDASLLGFSRRRSTHEFVLSKTRKLKKKTVSMSSAVDTSSSDEDRTLTRKSKKASVAKKRNTSTKMSNLHLSESGSDVSCCSNSGREERKTKKEEPTRSLVMTSLHFTEQDTVHAVVKRFGGFYIEETVSSATSHVVCGNNRRTLNVLLAISQGCWLVSLEWVFKSLEAGHWLDEEQFELQDIFPAAQVSRQERMSASADYKPSLFSQQGLIYVAENTAPPHQDLVKLLKLCGGQVTHCARKAKVCIGSLQKSFGINVSEKWVLDSITSQKKLPFDEYKL